MEPNPAADSVASTPRSDAPTLHDDQPRVRFMCSFGGKILPRPHDNQLRYVGGDTRIVTVNRHASFQSLLTKLAKLYGTTNISIKYQLPNEDLDSLITVTADEDVENMMEEYDRFANKSARLRIFLFPNFDETGSRASSISSLLDGSIKRENWFVDALNGGQGSGPGRALDRGRSEVSSIVSEVPDYLFGLDNNLDDKFRNKNLLNDNVSLSDPGSPAPVISSPFCSTSSSLAPQAIPDLPHVKTKPVNHGQVMDHTMVESQPSGYSGGPLWHYPGQAMQPMPTVYYVPGPGGHVQVQTGNLLVQPVPMRTQFVQQYAAMGPPPGQVPVAFPQTVSSMGQVYGGTMRQYENASPTMYYGQGVRGVGVVPGSYPGAVASGGEELQGPVVDSSGRVSHGS